MKKTALALMAGIAFSAGAAVAQSSDAPQVHVKKAIADRMTPDELAAYKKSLEERVFEKRNKALARATGVGVLAPSDTCGLATYEISTLPFNPAADTTVGMTDNYDLDIDVSDPTCTALATCTGGASASSGPRGASYTGTGTGPDKAYRIKTDANCTLTITADPTGTEDMALIVYQTNCSNSLADCACVDDTGAAGAAESITLDAVAGTDYFIVVDGYSAGATPPGPAGAFTLSIAGTGCTLLPVELQKFSVN